ncbi:MULTISPECIES: sialidase family protein [Acinetobacter]|uniref:Sialidase domain-containing protein n=1 Tax=Acinetobacter higginsii TaxID=70347 RepID=N8WAA0_9GAMM|nr:MULTISPECIES: sialidase family protein [Acinetobacter]ENV08992.1 hypothetical protein F966_02637 [Acinetobacter higginsii]NNP67530.1 hypothetical protein [Acinetobacter sp. Ac_5812]
MSVVFGQKREYEFTGNDLNNDPCIFPRLPSNHVFVQAVNFRTKNIVRTGNYSAFPFVEKLNGAIVGICSDGLAHAQSDRQVMFVSKDNGETYEVNENFFINDTLEYDFSLLESIMNDGDILVLKTFIIKKVAGVISATIKPFIYANSKAYAVWSRLKFKNGVWYRTGYYFDSVNGISETALFTSNDKENWFLKSIMFSSAGKIFTEADLVNTTGSTWIAYCREDSSGNSNPLYKSVSIDDGATWSAPVIQDALMMDGRQPNLTKISDGSIILATGDRSGSSGHAGSAGDIIWGANTTGVTIFRSTDGGVTWSYRTRIAPIFSTDGGQPFVVETTPARILCVYYARRRTKDKPIVASCSLDVTNL